MTRGLKAILAGVVAAVASLLVSLPVTVAIAERFSTTVNPAPSADDALTFRTTVTDVNLLPAFLLALAIFAATFVWMGRREAH
ncbi:MAG TPA: hypothetical protein VF456_09045 [Vicinamibacterales bacterium]